MTKTISRFGDWMLGAMLPKAKASACYNCQPAGVGCGGPVCSYFYSIAHGSGYRCYAKKEGYCGAAYYSYRSGCC